ncbi:MAG: glycoside hydrolase [Anaerolineaceae bacterium]|nr:glycoside hydrolase [Anaerolineaceae bacterium]
MPQNQIETVHVIFKTHLDVGFTDYAHRVMQTYFDQFIPAALRLTQQLRERGGPERFRWTTGSWLIYEYLEQASAEQRHAMETAIEQGDIIWHGLPFTTHTELMDESLFRFGLSLSQALDTRYGKQTIAAKMTDVPGHTRAMLPSLTEAGIQFLHFGVNEASTVPDVPPVFVWKDNATSSSVMVMYHGNYGDVTTVPDLSDAAAIILTNDNHGPPPMEAVLETFATLRERFPGAQVIASTMDTFATKLASVRDTLPVITAEIGDTWIHGVGADPTKIRQYRELSRLRRAWLNSGQTTAEDPHLHAFSRRLLLVPEHTWGMDEKTWLADAKHYGRDAFDSQRTTPEFQRFEESWAEQRRYIDEAVAELRGTDLEGQAQARLTAVQPEKPDFSLYEPIESTDIPFETRHFRFRLDVSGAFVELTERASGKNWANESHTLGLLHYELFSASDYARFWQQYIRNKDQETVRSWAKEDYTKPGLPVEEHRSWQPVMQQIWEQKSEASDRYLLALRLPDVTQQYGGPARIYMEYTFPVDDTRVDIALTWLEKPANRLAEAFWLSFAPLVDAPQNWQLQKIGQLVSPLDVVNRGARTLHAIDQYAIYQGDDGSLQINTLDAPLVAPGQPSLLDFHNEQPDMSDGVHFNLYNNTWGTNFPMWFEDDALFRFSLRFGSTG